MERLGRIDQHMGAGSASEERGQVIGRVQRLVEGKRRGQEQHQRRFQVDGEKKQKDGASARELRHEQEGDLRHGDSAGVRLRQRLRGGEDRGRHRRRRYHQISGQVEGYRRRRTDHQRTGQKTLSAAGHQILRTEHPVGRKLTEISSPIFWTLFTIDLHIRPDVVSLFVFVCPFFF